MRYRLKKSMAVMLAVLILTFMSPVIAYADDPMEAAFPSIDKMFDGQNNSPYLTTYKDNYYLDMVEYNFLKDTTGALDNSINLLVNVVFNFIKGIAYIVIVMFYYAFEINFYDMFSTLVSSFVTEMKTSLFDQVSLVCICILGLFYVVKIIQNQRTQVWVAIIQTIAVATLACYFFTHPLQVMKEVDEASNGLSKTVLTGTYKAANDNKTPMSALAAATNSIWVMQVHEPWELLEFGNPTLAKQETKNILVLKPGSDERKKYIKTLASDKQHFVSGWGIKRLGFVFIYAIVSLVFSIVLGALCFLILAYKFLIVLFAMFGVFIFILALVPFIGIGIVQNWFSKIIGFAGTKVIVCFLLAVLCSFNAALFKVAGTQGWGVLVLLQIVIAVVIMWKREAIFETFTTLRISAQNPAVLNKQLRKDTNVETKVHEFTKNTSLRRKNYSNRYTDDEGYSSRAESASYEYDGRETRTGNGGRPKVSDDSTAGSNSTLGGQHGQLLIETSEDKNNDIDNFRQLMKKAEEILEKQYDIEKAAAEESAQKNNKMPVYSDFVNKVNTRTELGAPKFDQREIVSLAKDLERVVRAGGKPEDLYSKESDKPKSSEVERPKDLITLNIKGEKSEVDREEAYKIIVENNSRDMVQEFNKDYGKNYDKKFMDELIRKYGEQQVRSVLNRMKEVQRKDGHINNPAGYLTQSLKNNVRDKVGIGNKEEGEEKLA